ncbi:hypothetical protein CSC75_05790 [Pseudoxanthomonas wuyuanensis]|nr:hypothetical protein CSC75_05790 [Pseudoxanthomonas wuyuanensis]
MALVVSFALPAVASNPAPQTEVSNLHFMPNGAVLFHTSTARADVPACAAGQTTRRAIDTNTAAGKAQLAGLLSAHSMGKKVQVFGTDTCSIWGDTESVSYLRLY